MHFITGGAFNGKRAWVKNTYNISEKAIWLSAYCDARFPIVLTEIDQDLIIIEGIEIWVKSLTEAYHTTECLKIWDDCLTHWYQWEKAKPNRQVVVIGTDITKGIVPLEAENRLWRDVTGWAYQKLAAKADKVDIVWYGINKSIK